MRIAFKSAAFCALALALVSCDDKSSPTSDPGRSNGKDQQLQTSCPSPKIFATIPHCPIGSATLTLTGSSLDVTGLSASDGVASNLLSTTLWNQTADIDFGGVGGAYTEYRSVSGGVLTSTMKEQQIALTPDSEVWADFTGGVNMRYRVELWGGGVLLGWQDNLTSASRIRVTSNLAAKKKNASMSGIASRTIRAVKFEIWNLVSPHPGACDFSLSPAPGIAFINVRLPNGTNYGGVEKIEMIETTAPGHYPYHTFDEIDIVGTVVGYSILSES